MSSARSISQFISTWQQIYTWSIALATRYSVKRLLSPSTLMLSK